MNYRHPELRALLAGEYVLGTLHGGARRRFEQLLHSDPVLRAEVAEWQEKLTPLDEAVEPIAPPPAVWAQIERRLGHAPDDPAQTPTSAFASLRLWRLLAVVTSVASLSLAVLLTQLPGEPPAPFAGDYVALVGDAEQRPLWLLRADSGGRRLRVEPLQVPAPPVGKAYELWLLPADGVPRSLGLLPLAGETTHSGALEVALAGELAGAAGVAVSLEPGGGSPTGLPTGPVLYQASLLHSES